jgi:hypothetical protein
VSDPLQLVWDALAARDCRPHGKPYSFRARCPAHNGENRDALAVAIGADGRAVLWCHAHQCDIQAVTSALGLSVQDLFPAGHHRARRLPSRPVKRSDFTGPAHTAANVIYGLEQAGMPWRLLLVSDCPYCGAQGAWLQVRSPGHVLHNGFIDERGDTDADCPEGCDANRYVQGLLGRAHDQKGAR